MASRIAETLELFQPDGPHPSSLVGAKSAYKTAWGAMYEGDAAKLLASLPDEALDLVITSPPYALHFKKEHGNVDKDAYVEWFRPFGREVHRTLKPKGASSSTSAVATTQARRRGPSTISGCF